jgi:putative endonuclease
MELSERLFKHNSRFYDKTYSSFTADWQLLLKIECVSVNQAIQIEKHIKRMKSKVYIENLKKYPEMVEKLLNLYRST